jgi:hypothetical protein
VAGACKINEQPPHNARRKSEEMGSTAQGKALLPSHFQEDFVDKGGRLQSVVKPLTPHVAFGDVPELGILGLEDLREHRFVRDVPFLGGVRGGPCGVRLTRSRL